jgi:hypothetical protein
MVIFGWLGRVESTTKYTISDVNTIKIGRQLACLRVRVEVGDHYYEV